jgi:hypothetical protein
MVSKHDKNSGVKSFITTVGSPDNIAALNDGILQMKPGGIRRFAILPQKGWEKPTKLCDGGPGGQGAGGDLKTDYIVVPTAVMVSTESCFDATKLPFPHNVCRATTYGTTIRPSTHHGSPSGQHPMRRYLPVVAAITIY